MKYITAVFVLCAFGITMSAQAKPTTLNDLKAPEAGAETVAWQHFSKNLVHALQSDNEGVRQAAMRLVIQHGSQVQVEGAVFDVVRIYRNHTDDNMRRMAVVTLSKMQDPWAMDFLKRSVSYEKSPVVRQTIQAVLSDYTAALVSS